MFPTYPEGWDSCQRADRVTEPHFNYQVLICAELCHHSSPRCGCSAHAGRSQGTYSHPQGMAVKGFWCKGRASELHFPFLPAEKACLGPPRINKTRSPSSRGHDLLHQAFPSHAAGIAHALLPSAGSRDPQSPGWHGAGLLLPNPIRAAQQRAFVLQSRDAPHRKSTSSGKTNRG